ncbi:hypothetical protein OPT61_g7447 [Boeremia exigua]|uniref:Uncharacterized protein n=1 Tax=Boeremia exigua TaxID=749465 RepID=A0ACC2I3A0_9PLEO|nr:hypothetical protein OPT61_g7447 [Boeremia exigua]
MQNTMGFKNAGGVALAGYEYESETRRQRTQQETNLLSLINPTLAVGLANTRPHSVKLMEETLPVEQNALDEEGEDSQGDDIDVATGCEEGESDIPQPLPKVLTAAQKKKKIRQEKVMSRNRGSVLQTISPSDFQLDESLDSESKVTWNEDPELLCSYNWSSVVDGSNTIFVPGDPSKWSPPAVPYKVPGDKGLHPTDYNYVRQPNAPFSPVFHAMTLMNPDYAFNDIDLLADRNNLRTLLEFVQGKPVGPFRLDLHMVFNTLIMVRREETFWRYSDGSSYGFNFEKHFTTTTPDMADATSHYRAIRYRLGSLNVVCRFEADAYVDTTPLSEPEAAAAAPPTLANTDLMNRPHFTHSAPFKVLQKGHIVPGDQILELKTQVDKPLVFQSPGPWLDQLWFGRTKNLFTGRYESGTGKILYLKQYDATERLKTWEDRNQLDLQKLVALLKMLKGIVMKQKGPQRSAILVREDSRGPLTVYQMLDGRNLVQRQFFERHWMRNAREGSNTQQGARGGAGQQPGRGRSGVYGGRGRGQAEGQWGSYAQRGHAGAQGSQVHQPHGPVRYYQPNENPGVAVHPDRRRDNPSAGNRGGAGRRGRGNASRGGRGSAEQGGS